MRASRSAQGNRATIAVLVIALQTHQALAGSLPVPVVEAPVRRSDVPIVLSGLGTVHPVNVATIDSQITGMLQKVDFVEGQQVHTGEILAELDPRPYQARLAQAQAQLGRDQAQLASVRINLSRNVPLLKHGFATDQQVTDQQLRVAQLQNTVKFDQAAVDDARTQLSYATLTAPFDGITGIKRIDIGNIIRPTDATGLVKVTQIQPIAVLFTLPTSSIAPVEDALSHGPLLTTAYDQSATRVLDIGRLLLVDNEADPRTGTVQLKAVFPNPKRLLWPGMFVNVDLAVSTAKGGLTVPIAALQQGQHGQFVFAVGTGGQVSVQPVEVTQQLRGTALVTGGLRAGEMVVVEGQYGLAAGTQVTEANPGQVANSSAATVGLLP